MQYGTHYSLRAQMSGKEIDSIPTVEEGKRENLLQVEKKDEEIDENTQHFAMNTDENVTNIMIMRYLRQFFNQQHQIISAQRNLL